MPARPALPIAQPEANASGFFFAANRLAADKRVMVLVPLGDSAYVYSLGAGIDGRLAAQVQALAAELRRSSGPGLQDVVPAFASLGLFFEPGRAPEAGPLEELLRKKIATLEVAGEAAISRQVEIPVCYGGGHGPDLDALAAHTGMSAAEVMVRHSREEYLVHAIGFSPGFPYLGGLPPELAMPRRTTPRLRVPPGSVAIGGAQTGVYPLETPGGWNLIGRTPLRLFDPWRREPALLRAGDRVKFRAIPSEELELPPLAQPAGEPTRGPGLEIVRAGMYTTVQDLGCVGHRDVGVAVAGAADSLAARLANLIVGNPEQAAGLEATLVGPEIRFGRDAVVALGGADFEGLASWRPVVVKAGTVLKLGAAKRGCRGFLAIAGGVEVPSVLGSRSTHVRAGFGGWHGRVLREGDHLPMAEVNRTLRGAWRLDPRILPAYGAEPVVRILPGAQTAEFSPGWQDLGFTVRPQSDRMGVRLAGPALVRAAGSDLVSSPVSPGTIQVPPDGQPIVLLADAQTIGGYPQIAQVASVDLPLVAQLRPGDTVRFRVITLAEARSALAAREQALALLRTGLKEKWG